jgi:hypothetical protein
MVKVKVVNKDNTDSIYNVTYPNAYVQKIIDEENLRGDDRKVKEIYVNEEIVAKLKVSCGVWDLVHHSNSDYNKSKEFSQSTEALITRHKTKLSSEPSFNKTKTTYWVTDHTGGSAEITYNPKSL